MPHSVPTAFLHEVDALDRASSSSSCSKYSLTFCCLCVLWKAPPTSTLSKVSAGAENNTVYSLFPVFPLATRAVIELPSVNCILLLC